jgi:hypothetical protein
VVAVRAIFSKLARLPGQSVYRDQHRSRTVAVGALVSRLAMPPKYSRASDVIAAVTSRS